MESLSQYSKDVREELKLSLQEVYNRTDIDVTLLGIRCLIWRVVDILEIKQS